MPLDKDIDALADELLETVLKPEVPEDLLALVADDANTFTSPEDGLDAFDPGSVGE